MKHILVTTLFILFSLFAPAQDDVTIDITWTGTDFTLEEITEIGPDLFDIQRWTGLDSAEVKNIVHTRINDAYQREATFYKRRFNEKRKAVILRKELIANNMDTYFEDKEAELDSTYINPTGWRYRNTGTGTDMILSTIMNANGRTVFRDTSNTNVLALTPFSLNNLRAVFLNNFDTAGANGDAFIQLYSDDQVIYVGEDSAGGRVFLIKQN